MNSKIGFKKKIKITFGKVNMDANLLKFVKILNSHKIVFKASGFNSIIQNYKFHYISESTKEEEKVKINESIKNSEIIVIYMADYFSEAINYKFLIIVFEETIIILDQSLISFLQQLLSANSELFVCVFPNANSIIQDLFILKNKKIEIDENFEEEISSLSKGLCLLKAENSIKKIWSCVIPCFSGFLIKKSYLKLRMKRIEKFIKNFENDISQEIISEKDYIELRIVGTGSLFRSVLVYHIKREELYVIKKPYGNDTEKFKLMEREKSNYKKVMHPFFPRYYGIVKDFNYIVIEFISGITLDKINQISLESNDIISIIVELMLIFEYIHSNKLIYRDLKPDNIMIDENKTIVLIDLDRMIEEDDSLVQTLDLGGKFHDPDISRTKKFSYGSDIYLLGKMFEFILIKTKPLIKFSNDIETKIKGICQKCTNEKTESRPSIIDLIK